MDYSLLVDNFKKQYSVPSVDYVFRNLGLPDYTIYDQGNFYYLRIKEKVFGRLTHYVSDTGKFREGFYLMNRIREILEYIKEYGDVY